MERRDVHWSQTLAGGGIKLRWSPWNWEKPHSCLEAGPSANREWDLSGVLQMVNDTSSWNWKVFQGTGAAGFEGYSALMIRYKTYISKAWPCLPGSYFAPAAWEIWRAGWGGGGNWPNLHLTSLSQRNLGERGPPMSCSHLIRVTLGERHGGFQ